MTLREKLLADAKAYCEHRGIKPTYLGKLVVNDTTFFDRLEKGGDCTTRNYERFQAYFQNDDQAKPGGAATPTPPAGASTQAA